MAGRDDQRSGTYYFPPPPDAYGAEEPEPEPPEREPPKQKPPKQEQSEQTKLGCFGTLIVIAIIGGIWIGIERLLGVDDEPSAPVQEVQTAAAPPSPSTPAVPPTPPPELPDNVTIRINQGYDDISVSVLERVLAEIADWYQQEYGLVAETRSEIAVEPQCQARFAGEVLGYARRVAADDGSALIEICVRLDEDTDAAVQSDEFKWLLAHEYFHVLQANAGWAFEDSDALFGDASECGRHLTEGSAEYFAQIFAWGERQEVGLLDLVGVLLGGDEERWYYYDNGAEAFEALIAWKGKRRATQFWESDETNCANAFLAAFDVAPGKYEADWRELTGR